jgi:1-acyl-sn-glycerol-3-phosphate acyltransferase|tara:strand:- start:163984 stop:164841 length:858 start_codon:yes stop_codon:yes gene_type:complete
MRAQLVDDTTLVGIGSGWLRHVSYAVRVEARRSYRLVRVVAHIFYGLLLSLLLAAYWQPRALRVRRAAQRWQRTLLGILNVDVEVLGRPDADARFFVSNHISWLDIPVIGAAQNVHFLSKAEVRDWPLIGQLASAAGTLYIRRGSGESHRKADELASYLMQGTAVLVFPEGTTTDGQQLRRFFPALFRAPVMAQVVIQPLAVRYLDAQGGVDEQPAFLGEDTFQGHLWRLLRRDHIRVQLCWLPSIDTSKLSSKDASALCATAQHSIERVVLGMPFDAPNSALIE